MNDFANTAIASSVVRSWGAHVKRLGVCGFWFFLVKGLLWMTAPYVVYAMTSLADRAQ